MKNNKMIDERTGLIIYKKPRNKMKKVVVFGGVVIASIACAATIATSGTSAAGYLRPD